ncbi:hypothetical protein [Candidatus Bathycorpusculum sp.]|uniref:hypothetical protein n=1 Tax=Candidatus Bathycorpusculum sp. TaxID=2994959 RepID=UPI00282B442A|nr:hypothetical protein [Candidatus Termitimicrobium sp.]MCL2685627.1 hypothetical protein [Candidatus Termitimicrobium sp.]
MSRFKVGSSDFLASAGRHLGKALGLFLIVVIGVSGAVVVYSFQQQQSAQEQGVDEFYFGVSFGGQTPEEAKVLVDKVKDYTNVFLINSYDLSVNESALSEVCDYVAQSGLKFTVYFEFVSRVTYPWHQTWLDSAPVRWGDSFLGVYFYDEPGGKQLDTKQMFSEASSYCEAADFFVQTISQTNSMIDLKNRSIPVFTSDYVLYWWDYLAGYDVVYAELGWELDSRQQIALCRGAATTQNKTWGAIIVWSYYEPPYMASAQEIYQEMLLAYEAGAKYVTVFNYPTYPEDNPYGVLSEDHFIAMENFWNHTKTNPRPNPTTAAKQAQVVLVLPPDYGWGIRRNKHLAQDNIWGLWPEDEKAPPILENLYELIDRYGLDLDIVFDDPAFDFNNIYHQVYYWNQTKPNP